MPDFIPTRDADFRAWLTNFQTYLAANAVALGITALEATLLGTQAADLGTAIDDHVAAQATAQSKREAKDLKRDTVEKSVRSIARRVQAAAAVTDAQREALGITVPDRSKTPAAAPTTAPDASVDTGTRLRHTLRLSDADGAPSGGKPRGVLGAEVWMKVCPQGAAAPAADPAEMSFVGVQTKTRFTVDLTPADAGKAAFYRMRWVNSRGEKGPWSEAVCATIAA
jgi:hypothetical protein